uniref:Uncharacterized protein n=1 Tax=Triticum urartu TaxID=4572 RepID=A0A8R7PRP8_TRIUA
PRPPLVPAPTPNPAPPFLPQSPLLLLLPQSPPSPPPSPFLVGAPSPLHLVPPSSHSATSALLHPAAPRTIDEVRTAVPSDPPTRSPRPPDQAPSASSPSCRRSQSSPATPAAIASSHKMQARLMDCILFG